MVTMSTPCESSTSYQPTSKIWLVRVFFFIVRCATSTGLTNLLLIIAILTAGAIGGVLTIHIQTLTKIYDQNGELSSSVKTLAAIEALRLYQSGISPESIAIMLAPRGRADTTPAPSAPVKGK
jgi:type III secretory pathway component EscS